MYAIYIQNTINTKTDQIKSSLNILYKVRRFANFSLELYILYSSREI